MVTAIKIIAGLVLFYFILRTVSYGIWSYKRTKAGGISVFILSLLSIAGAIVILYVIAL